MTKTKKEFKQIEKGVSKDESKEELTDKECAQEIDSILKSKGRGLQPFIERTDFGEVARVRLVRVKVELPNLDD